ncbi:hypothetical protein AB0J77_14475 [Micromonospora tulbaghiae]|uniref:hypothetical protein n=1 Tax=Micromonospora tulbaghiae TaxID=479978 RepID=UPI0034291848
MSRDYVAEMRSVIDAETSHGPYSSPIVAEHIVEKLRATDPDLLAGWLDAQAVGIIRHAINLRDCSVRSRVRATSSRSVFARQAAEHEAGDRTALSGWLSVVHVVGDGSRKRLAEMQAEDLAYVADDYGRRAAENALAESFLRALARKVGSGKVADHFTDEQLTELWQSITGR